MMREVKGRRSAAHHSGARSLRHVGPLSTAVLGAEELNCTGTEHFSRATIQRATLETTNSKEMMWL